MRKMKQFLALTLAVSLVLGSAITALADEPTNGSSEGAGSAEGHVEKKATSVELPTIAEGSTPFAYTMDPEGLIQETSNAKYGSAVEFPAKAGDTYVYFNNGKKGGDGTDKDNIVYANTSAAQTVTNKSSHAISLTVTAAASNADTDIPLVAKDAIASASAASLYLGLKVGSETAVAVSTETAASKTVTIDGTPANFKIAVKEDNSGYEYRALTLAEYKAIDGNSSASQADYDATWATADFNVEGAVTTGKDITSTTTAPTLTVTWAWTDPSAAPTTYTVTYNANHGDTPATAPETVNVGEHPTGTGEAVVALKTGYENHTFAGWFDGAGDDATEVSDLNTISTATTLYAHWTEDSALSATTISKANGGSITVTGKTVSSIVMKKNDGTNVTATNGTQYSLSGSTYTFAASVLANKTKITFNFTDSTSEEVTVE